jgi:hypothetical protein
LGRGTATIKRYRFCTCTFMLVEAGMDAAEISQEKSPHPLQKPQKYGPPKSVSAA